MKIIIQVVRFLSNRWDVRMVRSVNFIWMTTKVKDVISLFILGNSTSFVYLPIYVNFHLGDCKDLNGVKDVCVVAAINNYTTQLLDYGKKDTECNKKNLAMTF